MADCNNCTETCPKAELAHETAKGRMYATQELVELVKKIESGQLVEVVRCKDCKHWEEIKHGVGWCCATTPSHVWTKDDEYCKRGEREET